MGERCNHEWLATSDKPVECVTCGARRGRRLIGWRVRYEGRLSGTWRANKAWLTDYDSAWEHARSLRGQPSLYRKVKVMRVYRRRAK